MPEGGRSRGEGRATLPGIPLKKRFLRLLFHQDHFFREYPGFAAPV